MSKKPFWYTYNRKRKEKVDQNIGIRIVHPRLQFQAKENTNNTYRLLGLDGMRSVRIRWCTGVVTE